MINKDVREQLPEFAILFEKPAFDNSIIGTTYFDEVVYNYDDMVRELMKDDNIKMQDAIDFIEVNTLKSLGYPLPVVNKPIVIFPIERGTLDND